MSLPDLTPLRDYFDILPPGIHECTAEEIQERFGKFQQSDTRANLTRSLVEYLRELKLANIGKYLIINGSYVTKKDEPNDIDMLLVLRDDFDAKKEVPPFQYNARSKKYVRKYYNIDFYFGFENDPSSIEMIKLFKKVKSYPDTEKGILKIQL